MNWKETQFKAPVCLGFQTKARIYIPHEKILYSQMISGYFTSYPEKFKEYRFYIPNHSPKIMETGNARFVEE